MHADACGMITEVLGTSQCSKQSSYWYFLALHLIESYYILLSCVLTGVRTDQVRLLTSRRFPTVERKLQRLQGQGQSLSLFHAAIFLYFAPLPLACDLWHLVAKFELSQAECHVSSFLARSLRGLSLRGDNHVPLPCDEDISHLFVSEAGEPGCCADVRSKSI